MSENQKTRADATEGWEVAPTGDDVARWLTKEDLRNAAGEGLAWQGRLLDALLMPPDENGKPPRVAYVIALTAEPPLDRKKVNVKTSKGPIEVELAVGDVVAFGEKGFMKNRKSFRGARLGDEIRFKCTGDKDVGQLSPMMTFATAIRHKPGNTLQTAQAKLDSDFKSGRGVDAWDAAPASAKTPSDGIPF